ncbi:MAG: hypothetical protein O3C58_12310 [Nitrospinae bacterium]|nr:hypothetical protein [Nitrospinota bacterium]
MNTELDYEYDPGPRVICPSNAYKIFGEYLRTLIKRHTIDLSNDRQHFVFSALLEAMDDGHISYHEGFKRLDREQTFDESVLARYVDMSTIHKWLKDTPLAQQLISDEIWYLNEKPLTPVADSVPMEEQKPEPKKKRSGERGPKRKLDLIFRTQIEVAFKELWKVQERLPKAERILAKDIPYQEEVYKACKVKWSNWGGDYFGIHGAKIIEVKVKNDMRDSQKKYNDVIGVNPEEIRKIWRTVRGVGVKPMVSNSPLEPFNINLATKK